MAATNAPAGLLGIYDSLDATVAAIQGLRAIGLKTPTVFSPAPEHEIEHALHPDESPVRLFTLVGGLTGAATGFALPTWTSLDWPLVTGGKPIISLPPFVIIAFELTILFGALATVLGLFLATRLPHRGVDVLYDPSFSSGRFGIRIDAPADRVADVRQILSGAGAAEVREGEREVTVA
jgi:hypothetical protein